MSSKIQQVYNRIDALLELEPSRGEFCKAFKAGFQVSGLSVRDVCRELRIRNDVLWSWLNGETAPHSVGRPAMLNWMLDVLSDKMN